MGRTSYLVRKILKILLTALFGIFYVPPIGFGIYLFICWVRIHISDVYYGDSLYLLSALLWIGVGLVTCGVTWYGAWRRSFYGLILIIPLFLGLLSIHLIPNVESHVTTLVSDYNFAKNITDALQDWYEKRQEFPSSESEFWEALARGTSSTIYRASPVTYSKYRQRGSLLPYLIIVSSGARGARTTDVSERPGVVYYCVSADLHEFWITMTGLESDLGTTATLRQLTWWEGKASIHRAGSDYQSKRQ
jgi:hypothetical protein